MRDIIGKELSGFKVVEELAEGGMALIYKGIRLSDSRPVAIKILRSEVAQKRENRGRLLREAMIYEKIRHPNVIEYYAAGFDSDVGFYLVTELLVGDDLESLMMERGNAPLDFGEAFSIALQVCAGLSAAHSKGIIHRDLKPSNIFITKDRYGEDIVKLFDFGIGKSIESENGDKKGAARIHQMTMMGIALGTPLYMAPEQIKGQIDELGPYTDIYSFGIILFQMFTGKLPYTGPSPTDIFVGHLVKKIPPIGQYNKKLSGTILERTIKEMMIKKPNERPDSIEYIREKLWESQEELLQSDEMETQLELPQYREEIDSK